MNRKGVMRPDEIIDFTPNADATGHLIAFDIYDLLLHSRLAAGGINKA
jgi:hypothetical protein